MFFTHIPFTTLFRVLSQSVVICTQCIMILILFLYKVVHGSSFFHLSCARVIQNCSKCWGLRVLRIMLPHSLKNPLYSKAVSQGAMGSQYQNFYKNWINEFLRNTNVTHYANFPISIKFHFLIKMNLKEWNFPNFFSRARWQAQMVSSFLYFAFLIDCFRVITFVPLLTKHFVVHNV